MIEEIIVEDPVNNLGIIEEFKKRKAKQIMASVPAAAVVLGKALVRDFAVSAG